MSISRILSMIILKDQWKRTILKQNKYRTHSFNVINYNIACINSPSLARDLFYLK